MASGVCQKEVECCVSWFGSLQPNAPAADQCLCFGGLAASGISSCAEAAATLKGTVVDLCPRYRIQ